MAKEWINVMILEEDIGAHHNDPPTFDKHELYSFDPLLNLWDNGVYMRVT